MLEIGVVGGMSMTIRIEIVVLNILGLNPVYISKAMHIPSFTHQYPEVTGLKLVLRKAVERYDQMRLSLCNYDWLYAYSMGV